MKAISQLVVHVFDLIEAEGASLLTVVRGEASRCQGAVINLALAAAMLVVSLPLLLGGAALLAAALMWWLETHMSRPAAAAITGGVVLLLGLGCIAGFKAIAGKAQA